MGAVTRLVYAPKIASDHPQLEPASSPGPSTSFQWHISSRQANHHWHHPHCPTGAHVLLSFCPAYPSFSLKAQACTRRPDGVPLDAFSFIFPFVAPTGGPLDTHHYRCQYVGPVLQDSIRHPIAHRIRALASSRTGTPVSPENEHT